MGDLAALQSADPFSHYITRPEFTEVRNDVKTLERQMVEVQTMQGTQQATLNEILSTVRKQGSVRAMVIAGFSGLGGGVAAGAVYLLHWLSQ
ncbi:hypothetical protein AD947_07310 [Acetobacter tropicalis]|uniref:Uncharacterized protein n=1 Tax=Acetobacter tropicalis TaxID=104102 RepID=A0A149TXW2_9PROT|nr:hypothetical protein [Acetobacter tropicalis]KXV57990.1 hypothetical protein AD947_07310 [Acetobacter tropicalis]